MYLVFQPVFTVNGIDETSVGICNYNTRVVRLLCVLFILIFHSAQRDIWWNWIILYFLITVFRLGNISPDIYNHIEIFKLHTLKMLGTTATWIRTQGLLLSREMIWPTDLYQRRLQIQRAIWLLIYTTWLWLFKLWYTGQLTYLWTINFSYIQTADAFYLGHGRIYIYVMILHFRVEALAA